MLMTTTLRVASVTIPSAFGNHRGTVKMSPRHRAGELSEDQHDGKRT